MKHIEHILRNAMRSSKMMSPMFYELQSKCARFSELSSFVHSNEGLIAI